MTNRTTRTVVHFSNAFMLRNFDKAQPGGHYQVDHDEESIDGASWIAWHRVGSFIHLAALGGQGAHQMVPTDPADLNAALEIDHGKSQTL